MKTEYKLICLIFLGLTLAGRLGAQEPDSTLAALSLDELLNIKINTAAKYEQTISEAPASVTIITADEIKAYGFATLEDVFKSVRGFYTSFDRNYSYLGARGFSRPTDYNNRILLLINGHTTNENYYGSAYLGTEAGLNLGMIERLEIVRGSSSALYGTSALFAIINIITKKGRKIDGLEIGAGAGSYGSRRGAAQFGKEFANGVEMMIAGLWGDSKGQNHYYREYDDPATNNGVAQNLDGEKYAGAFANLDYKNWVMQGVFSSRRKAVPTASFETIFNDPAFETTDEHAFAEIKYAGAIAADKYLLWRGYYDYYCYRGVYPYETIYRDRNLGHWAGSELQLRWDPRPNHRITFGMEYQKHLRAEYLVLNGTVLDFKLDLPFSIRSFYLQDENQLTQNLALTFGMRWDEYSTLGSANAPRVAIVYHPRPSGTLKLLYGEAFRAPSLWESRTDINFYKPNPALMPERIKTREAVWEQRLSAALFGMLSVYHYTMRDLIDPIVDPADGFTQHRNISRAKAYGFEVELNARFSSGRQGFASYSYQNAKDATRKEKALTNSPRHLAKMGVIFPVTKRLLAVLQMQYETERITVYKTRTAPFLLTNFRLSTTPGSENSWLRGLNLSAAVNNLFDVRYQNPGGVEHHQPAITQNGRNFSVELKYKF
jgi:iron complex outermembrane receptor protein